MQRNAECGGCVTGDLQFHRPCRGGQAIPEESDGFRGQRLPPGDGVQGGDAQLGRQIGLKAHRQ